LFDSPLSGRVWPIHLKPYADELLSSWVVRLSRAYGMVPHRFCATLWRHAAFWDRDIDKGIDDDLLRVLADKTATPLAHVLATTVRGYPGFPTRELRRHGRSPWLLRTGVCKGQRHRAGVSYCPACLQEDHEPYFRRPWRLTFVTVCPQHHCQLLDRCAACTAPCSLLQVPSDTEAITCCSHCQFDARRARVPEVPSTADCHQVLQFQTVLVEALHRGWYPLVRANAVLTAEYLSVLQHLGHLVLTRQRAHALRREFGACTGVPSLLSSQERTIAGLSITDRFTLMRLLGWWLEEWPERFVAMGAMAQLTRTDLNEGFSCQPNWYAAAVTQVVQSRLAGMNLVSYSAARAVASACVRSHQLL
jgi:hypothetical protein